MPAMPPPVLTELDGLIEYIAQQQDAFRIVAFGLTDEQARLTPTAGTLSIGGLIKHVTNMQAGWTDRIRVGARTRNRPPACRGRVHLARG